MICPAQFQYGCQYTYINNQMSKVAKYYNTVSSTVSDSTMLNRKSSPSSWGIEGC